MEQPEKSRKKRALIIADHATQLGLSAAAAKALYDAGIIVQESAHPYIQAGQSLGSITLEEMKGVGTLAKGLLTDENLQLVDNLDNILGKSPDVESFRINYTIAKSLSGLADHAISGIDYAIGKASEKLQPYTPDLGPITDTYIYLHNLLLKMQGKDTSPEYAEYVYKVVIARHDLYRNLDTIEENISRDLNNHNKIDLLYHVKKYNEACDTLKLLDEAFANGSNTLTGMEQNIDAATQKYSELEKTIAELRKDLPQKPQNPEYMANLPTGLALGGFLLAYLVADKVSRLWRKK